jgi:hypothetical protein
MSDYTSLSAASLALQKLLKEEITDSTDPQLSGVDVFLYSPKRMKEENEEGISLWLYRVNREPDTLNRPPERIGPNLLRSQPLPLTLYFLITPMLAKPQDEQAVLGKVVQVLNDHAIVRGAQVGPVLGADGTELHIALDGLTLEELARVWDVLKEPYQLSVCYLVQTVKIDSDLDVSMHPPVLTGEDRVHQIVGRSLA